MAESLFDECEEIFGAQAPAPKMSHYEREALENKRGTATLAVDGASEAVRVVHESRLILEDYEQRALRLAWRALQWAADSRQHEALGFEHPWDIRNAADVMGTLVTKSEKAKEEAAKAGATPKAATTIWKERKV